MYPISQLGGIINHTENLIYGLQELGHEVDMARVIPATKYSGGGRHQYDKFQQGALYPLHQLRGWIFPKEKTFPYRGSYNKTLWKKFASKFDAIIWQIPVPGLRKEYIGDTEWLELYDTGAINIAMVHDPHFQKRNAHFINVSEWFKGIVCVHTAAFKNTRIDIPKVMILNPHYIPNELDVLEYKDRKKGFIAAHYFKKIKRMDDLVKAIPFMDKGLKKILAGDGIEYHYMVSKTKMKKCYRNPETGRPIWDEAVDNGLKYLGMIHTDKRDFYLANLRTSVDPSWHEGFAKYGAVFNRSPIESIIQGCIVCAVGLGISGSADGNGVMWKANENYICIPHTSSPQDFAQIVDWANNLSNNDATTIQDNAFELIDQFDRKVVAQQFIDFIKGNGGGYYGKRTIGKINDSVRQNADRIMSRHFGRIS